jgi:hypothetical protein
MTILLIVIILPCEIGYFPYNLSNYFSCCVYKQLAANILHANKCKYRYRYLKLPPSVCCEDDPPSGNVSQGITWKITMFFFVFFPSAVYAISN